MVSTQPLTSWCEIDRNCIAKNLEIALSLLPKGTRFCAVLKADAYGHGIDQVVPIVIKQGVDCVGITSNAEAEAVRNAGFCGQLLRLRAATAEEIEGAAIYQLEEQVSSIETALKLKALAQSGEYKSGIHLALNANGMSRDGLELETAKGRESCKKIIDYVGHKIVGICSHFPSNDPAQLRQSAELFQQHTNWVISNSQLDRNHLLVHAGSSLTLVSGEKTETDMYRCGALLYGILKPELDFRTPMALRSKIVSIGEFPQGATVGYDRSKTLDKDRRLACVSIGYANGFYRHAHQGAFVSIDGKPCEVVGKVSMNTIVVDVTEVPKTCVGDVVTIFGSDEPGAITSAQAEKQFDTILADLFADWGHRNPRVYK